MNQKNLLDVDWSKIPAPIDDGAATHLVGLKIPPVSCNRRYFGNAVSAAGAQRGVRVSQDRRARQDSFGR
jgi:hypothetical protein